MQGSVRYEKGSPLILRGLVAKWRLRKRLQRVVGGGGGGGGSRKDLWPGSRSYWDPVKGVALKALYTRNRMIAKYIGTIYCTRIVCDFDTNLGKDLVSKLAFYDVMSSKRTFKRLRAL